MGLDMYMYKIEKLTEDEASLLVGLSTRDIAPRYHYIDKDTFDEWPDMYSDLIPFICEIPVIATMFNQKACFEAHGISERDELCGSFYSHDRAGWSFASGAKIEIDRAEYESYFYEQEVLIYVFKSKEVAYWRKAYDLDDFLQNARIICRTRQMIEEEGRVPTDKEILSWKTENCGYYMLCPDEKTVLRAYIEEHEDEDEGGYALEWDQLLDDENSVLMYHAWW